MVSQSSSARPFTVFERRRGVRILGGGAAGESREADASAPECNATSRSSQFGEAALAMLIGVLSDRSAFCTRRRRWRAEHAVETRS